MSGYGTVCGDCVACSECGDTAFCTATPGTRPCSHDQALCDNCRLEVCGDCRTEAEAS